MKTEYSRRIRCSTDDGVVISINIHDNNVILGFNGNKVDGSGYSLVLSMSEYRTLVDAICIDLDRAFG